MAGSRPPTPIVGNVNRVARRSAGLGQRQPHRLHPDLRLFRSAAAAGLRLCCSTSATPRSTTARPRGPRPRARRWLGLFQVGLQRHLRHTRSDYHSTRPRPSTSTITAATSPATFDIYDRARPPTRSLEGDGTARLHLPCPPPTPSTGWADAFAGGSAATRPIVDGIEDAEPAAGRSAGRGRLTYLFNAEITRSATTTSTTERTGASLGHEWDAQVTAAITPNLSVAAQVRPTSSARRPSRSARPRRRRRGPRSGSRWNTSSEPPANAPPEHEPSAMTDQDHGLRSAAGGLHRRRRRHRRGRQGRLLRRRLRRRRRGPKSTKARLGFIALTDASPLIIAKERGLFTKHGLPDVEVLKQASWGATRDNLVLGSGGGGIDGAHILSPMPYQFTTGVATGGKPTADVHPGPAQHQRPGHLGRQRPEDGQGRPGRRRRQGQVHPAQGGRATSPRSP